MIYDEAAYVLVPLKNKFKSGGYVTAFDIYIEKRLYDFPFLFFFSLSSLTYYRVKPSLRLLPIENTLLETSENLVVQVRKSKTKDKAFKKQQEEEKLKNQQLENKLKGKPRVIYCPSKQNKFKKDIKSIKKSKNTKHSKSKSKKFKNCKEPTDPLWKWPTPIEVENLIRQESEKGRIKRGLSIELQRTQEKTKNKHPSLKTKKLPLKLKKTQQKLDRSETKITHKPSIAVKGTKRYIKRGEEIRKAFEPPYNEVKQLPGIKGINKGIQATE